MKKERPTILFVGSVPVKPSSGGSIVIYRHLEAARDRFNTEVLAPPVSWVNPWSISRRLAAVMARLGQRRMAENLHNWIAGRWADPWLAAAMKGRKNVVVLTVAHGDLAYAAARCARHAGLPLATFFQDWWPDFLTAGKATRRRAERRFLQLHRESDVSFPTSNGMRRALGPHRSAPVLYPIPEEEKSLPTSTSLHHERPFRVLYFGNLGEYGPMLATALQESLKHPGIRLEARGSNPVWPAKFKEEMGDRGLWLDFAPRQECETWLESADAFLVTMSFEPALKRRMETSFLTKLTECSRYGRPLVIWGPEYSSAIKWGMESGAALCVPSDRPEELLSAITKIASCADLSAELGMRARQAYETQFRPDLLQGIFEENLKKIVRA